MLVLAGAVPTVTRYVLERNTVEVPIQFALPLVDPYTDTPERIMNAINHVLRFKKSVYRAVQCVLEHLRYVVTIDYMGIDGLAGMG